MIDSVFSRVFSYREREFISPLENFIIEIFSYCLEADPAFRDDFFENLLEINAPRGDFKILSQQEYVGFGRPDIEITFGDTIVLIECKVESGERKNQLSDYSSIIRKVKKDFNNKHIVYLTKYFEHKELNCEDIGLTLLRWSEVHDLITDKHNEITKQFKLFLKENNMEKVSNFTLQDLLAMKSIPSTLSKMDELLEQFKPEFAKEFGGFSKDSSRSTRLPNRIYINYVELHYDNNPYYLLIGYFWWWDEEEIPFAGISVELPKKKFGGSELFKILQKELQENKNWEPEEDDSALYFHAVKPLTDFISSEEDNIPAIKKFIQSKLAEVYQVRKKQPKTFRKTK